MKNFREIVSFGRTILNCSFWIIFTKYLSNKSKMSKIIIFLQRTVWTLTGIFASCKCMLHKSIWIELTKYFSFFQTHDVGFERLIKIIFGKHGGAVVVFSKPMVMVPSLFLIDKVPISSRNQFTSSSLRAASPSSSGSLATRNIRWPLQEQECSKNLAQCGNIRILLSSWTFSTFDFHGAKIWRLISRNFSKYWQFF